MRRVVIGLFVLVAGGLPTAAQAVDPPGRIAVSVPGSDVEAASMAATTDGRVAITWWASDGPEGVYGQWAVIRRADGTLTTPVRLGNSGGLPGAVAVDPVTGTTLIAFSRPWYEVALVTLPRGSETFAAPFAVAAGHPPVALTAFAGRATVALRSDDRGNAVRVLAARGALDGSDWSLVALSEPFDVGEYVNANPPEIVAAAGPAGATTVAWTQPGATKGQLALLAADVPANGDPSVAHVLSDPARSAAGAAIGADALGRATIAWVDAAPGWSTGRVLVATRPPAGTWSAPEDVGGAAAITRGPSARQPATTVTVGALGDTLVGWSNVNDPRQSSWAGALAAVAARGLLGGFSPPVILGTDFDDSAVPTALDLDGRAWAAVAGFRTSGIAVTTRNAGTWSPARTLTCPFDQAQPLQVLTTASGAPLVLWRQASTALDRRALLLAEPDRVPDQSCPRAPGSVVVSPARPRAGELVTLDATSFTDPRASTRRVTWTINDGTPIETGADAVLRTRLAASARTDVDVSIEEGSARRGSGVGISTSVNFAVCPATGCQPPPHPPQSPPPPPPATTTALSVLHAPARTTRRALATRGLDVRLSTATARRVRITLTDPRGRTLAARTVSTRAGRVHHIRVRLSRAGRKRLRPGTLNVRMLDARGRRLATTRVRVGK